VRLDQLLTTPLAIRDREISVRLGFGAGGVSVSTLVSIMGAASLVPCSAGGL
jgi:hypothetical protein